MSAEGVAGSAIEPAARLELLRWHIERADNQRLGMWARAAASLSANALIIAGTAIVASVFSSSAAVTRGGTSVTGAGIAIAALLMSTLSIFEATKTFSGIYKWPEEVERQPTEFGVLYRVAGTATAAGTYGAFRAAITARSLADELRGAELEFWRLSVLHERRMAALNRSVRYFVISVSLLVVALSIILISTVW